MMDQRSEEWFATRRGKLTCSEMGRVLKRSIAYRDQIRRELAGEVTERVYPRDPPSLAWGNTHEPMARAAYELLTDTDVRQVAFVTHPYLMHVGGSPDGLVGKDGGIEIKCPKDPAVHEATRVLGMPEQHLPQIHGLLWVTDRDWWDFISFDPRQEPPKDLYIERIHRDEGWDARLEVACDVFWEMVEGKVETVGAGSIPSLF